MALFDTTTTLWRYGGQEIIQSPAGTINQANVMQLLFTLLLLITSCSITIWCLYEAEVYNTLYCVYKKNKSDWFIIALLVAVVLFYIFLLLKLCALLPAIVL